MAREKFAASNGFLIMNNFDSFFPYKKSQPKIIYFDNATTTQKPQIVIEKTTQWLNQLSINPRHQSYRLQIETKKLIETIKEKIANFINAESNEFFFSQNSTFITEQIVRHLLNTNTIKSEDEILYCPYDHLSLINPFLKLKELNRVKLIDYTIFPHSGDADWRDILKKVNHKTKIIVLNHINSFFGLQTEVERLKGNLPEDTLTLLDATQSISHIPIDVKNLGVDILFFSGHKAFALEGVGGIYLSKKAQRLIDKTIFEKGTLPITGITSMDAAFDFIKTIGIRNIMQYNMELTQYLLQKLRGIDKIEFLPGVNYVKCASGYGIISFKVNNIPASDLAFALDRFNILTRANFNCLNNKQLTDNSIRVSLHINNSKEEIDFFYKVLKRILGI
jgi:cysteine desulfurase/selenocysteine lyase